MCVVCIYVCEYVCVCASVNVLIHLGRRSSLAQRALYRILEMPFCFTGHGIEREREAEGVGEGRSAGRRW